MDELMFQAASLRDENRYEVMQMKGLSELALWMLKYIYCVHIGSAYTILKINGIPSSPLQNGTSHRHLMKRILIIFIVYQSKQTYRCQGNGISFA